MNYRAEIDGLRALAVIPVILFHAGFEYFSGGFVGVDVFFVISGYLITTIILSEKEQGTFSLVKFYERRARRILPALFLVMFVSLPFAWLWLWPADMRDFSQSLMAVSIYVSNFLFWRESGYWGAANEGKPLLHTWSLAVEEQYYILFPLFLMLIWRFQKRWILASFVVIAAASLLLAQWGAYNQPKATFFLLPTRGWELAMGAGLSFFFLYRQQTIRGLLSNKLVNEAMGLVGLAMIAYAVYAFDETVPFPSFYALLPTVGTALLILFSSSNTLIGRLLGAKVLVGIGLMSYSAYLWHQPIFAFARKRSLTEPSDTLLLGLALLSFLLAYLSWRYVETPFRQRGVVSRKAVFSMALVGSVVFLGVGAAGHLSDGFAGRTAKSGVALQVIQEKLTVNYGLSERCDAPLALPSHCRTSDEPEILVWGDSYAMHLVHGITASNPDAKIIQMTKSVCGPFFDIAPVRPGDPAHWAEGCLEFTGSVRQWLKANESVKYAVLSSPFRQYIIGDTSFLLRDNTLVALNVDLAVQELRKTLDELEGMGIAPIVFSPTPATGANLGRCLAFAELTGASLDRCNFGVKEMAQDAIEAYRFLEQIETDHRVVRLDKFICDNARCVTHLGATYIYVDSGHLSREGSAALGKMNDFYGMIVAGAPPELGHSLDGN